MRDLTSEKMFEILSNYFDLENCYTYDLLRSKEAFGLGTMTIDDFEQWNEDNISDLANYIIESVGVQVNNE